MYLVMQTGEVNIGYDLRRVGDNLAKYSLNQWPIIQRDHWLSLRRESTLRLAREDLPLASPWKV